MSRLASELSQYCNISNNEWGSILGEILICLMLLQGSPPEHERMSREALCYLPDSLEKHSNSVPALPKPQGMAQPAGS